MRSAVSLAALARISPSFFLMAPETRDRIYVAVYSCFSIFWARELIKCRQTCFDGKVWRLGVQLIDRTFCYAIFFFFSSYFLLDLAATLLSNACHL